MIPAAIQYRTRDKEAFQQGPIWQIGIFDGEDQMHPGAISRTLAPQEVKMKYEIALSLWGTVLLVDRSANTSFHVQTFNDG